MRHAERRGLCAPQGWPYALLAVLGGLDEETMSEATWWYKSLRDAGWYAVIANSPLDNAKVIKVWNDEYVMLTYAVAKAQIAQAYDPNCFWRDFARIVLNVGQAIQAGMIRLSETIPCANCLKTIPFGLGRNVCDDCYQFIFLRKRAHPWSTNPPTWRDALHAYGEAQADEWLIESIHGECMARLADQLARGGVDSEFDRAAIRRRVEGELWWLSKLQKDLSVLKYQARRSEQHHHLGEHFRKTQGDWDGINDSNR